MTHKSLYIMANFVNGILLFSIAADELTDELTWLLNLVYLEVNGLSNAYSVLFISIYSTSRVMPF